MQGEMLERCSEVLCSLCMGHFRTRPQHARQCVRSHANIQNVPEIAYFSRTQRSAENRTFVEREKRQDDTCRLVRVSRKLFRDGDRNLIKLLSLFLSLFLSQATCLRVSSSFFNLPSDRCAYLPLVYTTRSIFNVEN